MALFNKIFSSRKKADPAKAQDNVRSKLFTFAKDQVRVVLYRECDFRGRRLLFDSASSEKVPLVKGENGDQLFAERTNNFGYLRTKPKADETQLGEIIFGSVAMSFRGTTYKIHSFSEPRRLMCTQVFPSPRKNNGRRSLPMQSFTQRSTTSSSLDRLARFDDSGTSSVASLSEVLSECSTASDTLLVCRKNRSHPLDVPNFSSNIPRLTVDSGYSCEQLSGSYSSGSPSFSNLDAASQTTGSKSTFSCGSLHKRLLRSANHSLEHSTGSLNGDELYSRRHKCPSKLGLAIVMELTVGQEENLERFLMEHAALIESMVWRARQGAETAYLRPSNFLSLMSEVSELVAQWLVDFLSGPYLSSNLWSALNCDNTASIKLSEDTASDSRTLANCDVTYKSNDSEDGRVDFPLLILSKLFKSDEAHKKLNRNFTAETFVKDLCELLEAIDVKHTNFFMSTLITAVLTHHLGWVTTVMPALSNAEKEKNCPGNPLWGQLIDLFGATGCPTKVCRTIVTGSEQESDLISKILNILTYFIRCNNIHRNMWHRDDKEAENCLAERICLENSCIPKENFKSYEDHVRELTATKAFLGCKKEPKSFGLKKSSTFLSELSAADDKPGMFKSDNLFDKVAHMGLQNGSEYRALTSSEINENLHKLCRVPTDQILKHVDKDAQENLVDIKEASEEIKRVFLRKESKDKEQAEEDGKDETSKVLFLLGDNEKLLGLSKEKTLGVEDEFKASIFKDSDFAWNNEYPIKPSTSCMYLHVEDEFKCEQQLPVKEFARSQSVPREEKPEGSQSKAKYTYSGVKFNFQQYPQIFTNYMKNKNIELSSLTFADKEIDSQKLPGAFDFSNPEGDFDDVETLETPSNATELEFSSELTEETCVVERSQDNDANKEDLSRVQMVQLPMPKVLETQTDFAIGYMSSLMRGLNDHYVPDMVLQGILCPKPKWEAALKQDLVLSTRYPFLDQQVDEAVAIIANKDTWEVLLMSSHKYVVDKGNSSGVRVGMSQLVANMLETLLHMWKLRTPPEYCLMHIEQKLQEFFIRSQALAQLLLATEFCSMELLTSTLQLEINDVPLIMAIASTHTPQIMHKYGLSFQ